VSSRAEDAPSAGSGAPVYVYGVVRSGALKAPDVEGVAQRSVATIEGDGLAALATELSSQPFRVRRRDLDRHLQVLEAVFEEATIVPCAFGTVLQSTESVKTDLLATRRDELLALLDRLEDRVQLNIKATYDEDTVLREVVESDAEIARLRGESRALGQAGHLANIRLGELVTTALTARAGADRQRIGDRLAAQADDVVADETTVPVVLKASFLVARDRIKSFDAALEALATDEAPRVMFESIGPLPPTAFAALEGA
jgi:Gas vesicle synthesis protein GvpL/GvpF